MNFKNSKEGIATGRNRWVIWLVLMSAFGAWTVLPQKAVSGSGSFQDTVVPGVTFLPPVSYGVGQGPVSVAVADFNGDGIADLAVANNYTATVSILLGNGNGTYQPQASYATNTGPAAVVVGDFNNDGKVDVAVYDVPCGEFGGCTGFISVLIGNGDGTFQPHVDYSYGISLGSGSSTVGDFNGDGNLDLAATNSGHGGGEVAILLGNGDGTFQGFVSYGATEATGVVAGDFNNDGKLDVAVADGLDAAVWVLLGNGDGSLQAPIETVTGGVPSALAAADFNGDGKLDVAVNDNFGLGGSILPGNGDGTFGAPPWASYDANGAPLLADFNNDGKLDLAAASGTEVTIDLGNGDGTFQTGVSFAAGTSVNAAAAGLLNRDNAQDLVVTDSGTSTANVLLNAGGTVMHATSSLNPSHQGQAVTFTTTVQSGISHQGVAGGTVSFGVDGEVIGTRPLVSGKASITISDLSTGGHEVTASFSGNVHFYRNTAAPFKQRVLP